MLPPPSPQVSDLRDCRSRITRISVGGRRSVGRGTGERRLPGSCRLRQRLSRARPSSSAGPCARGQDVSFFSFPSASSTALCLWLCPLLLRRWETKPSGVPLARSQVSFPPNLPQQSSTAGDSTSPTALAMAAGRRSPPAISASPPHASSPRPKPGASPQAMGPHRTCVGGLPEGLVAGRAVCECPGWETVGLCQAVCGEGGGRPPARLRSPREGGGGGRGRRERGRSLPAAAPLLAAGWRCCRAAAALARRSAAPAAEGGRK